MASETDIANMALAHLGEDATVDSFDPPDGSVHAEHCARFYPVARDMCLEAAQPSFARTTVQLTEAITAGDDYGFAYTLPSDCLKVLRIYEEEWRRDLTGIDEFEVETSADGQRILMCDLETPQLMYVRKVDDTSKFSPSFTLALSYLLASILAGPVLKGDTGQAANKYWMSIWRAFIGTASVLDTSNQRLNIEQWPSGILARR